MRLLYEGSRSSSSVLFSVHFGSSYTNDPRSLLTNLQKSHANHIIFS
jgi:hypothetical protein